ncbi:hypothetical protein J437_LFUL007701 [Ladona fulva]|uniref:gamma-glutamylcyclotransferase n=1 Tax=Ladona fulva TaxID=123851 RepID=A0A8K0NYB7_LADFU|nr:hypothetical protein J437_LFUL007701 [Ladona fulva]
MGNNTFLYFGFASNMLEKRVRLSCPSAQRKGKGKLKGYKLDFNYRSERWKGAMATLTEDPNGVVWGAVWEIPISSRMELDRKEGVESGVYRVLEVKVDCDGEFLSCWAYQCTRPFDQDRRPSPFYKSVILEGARETFLPFDYVKMLESIEDNGYQGEVDWNLELS